MLHTVGASMDLYVPTLDVYVEFDGPSHFFRTPGYRTERTGATRRKWQWLQDEGIKVVRIAHFEWQETQVRACVGPRLMATLFLICVHPLALHSRQTKSGSCWRQNLSNSLNPCNGTLNLHQSGGRFACFVALCSTCTPLVLDRH